MRWLETALFVASFLLVLRGGQLVFQDAKRAREAIAGAIRKAGRAEGTGIHPNVEIRPAPNVDTEHLGSAILDIATTLEESGSSGVVGARIAAAGALCALLGSLLAVWA